MLSKGIWMLNKRPGYTALKLINEPVSQVHKRLLRRQGQQRFQQPAAPSLPIFRRPGHNQV